MRNKKKLNIIKYNKRILVRLNINIEQYENYILLKEFNKKYNTTIEDIDNKQLNLEYEYIRNEGLNFLFIIEFKELKKLYLSNNSISDINILEKVNLKELKDLNLNDNKISDIKILKKVDFKELKKLNLSDNSNYEEEYYSILINLKSKINIII